MRPDGDEESNRLYSLRVVPWVFFFTIFFFRVRDSCEGRWTIHHLYSLKSTLGFF